ncbi:glycosyltransferase family 4 protein [Rothia sp. CCM 9417]|uniref:glycosyltransferase family 4 protein n=1 Tax=Rothia sp. CCM 9417 TaxID=3402657 RepID=UPI003ADAAACF
MKKLAEIVVIDPGAIVQWGNEYYLPERSYIGYKAYQDFLERRHDKISLTVLCLGKIRKVDAHEVARLKWFKADSLSVSPQGAQEYIQKCDGKTVILSLLNESTVWLTRLHMKNVKIVYLIENTRKNKVSLILSQGNFSTLSKFRAVLGSYRVEWQLQRAARKADGLQCNGSAAFRAYGQKHKNSILFYDHRVENVISLEKQSSFKDGANISVAFSGRIIKIKGSEYLSRISWAIYRANPLIKLYILGDGEDRNKVIAEGAPNIIYKGFMEYKKEWEPFVRKNIDIMLLPHIQGDPSMTYFESLGQGVPVIGFDNETLADLAQQGMGWVVPQGDVQQLVQKIMHLNDDIGEFQMKRAKAVEFMNGHVYSSTVKWRMDHIISSLRP